MTTVTLWCMCTEEEHHACLSETYTLLCTTLLFINNDGHTTLSNEGIKELHIAKRLSKCLAHNMMENHRK